MTSGRKVGNRVNININKLKSKPPKNDKEKIYYNDIESVVFVPFTPGSRLMKQMQTAEDNHAKIHNNPKRKFVERAERYQTYSVTLTWGQRKV